MLQITPDELKKRLALDNPWWETGSIRQRERNFPRRAYFNGFMRLIEAKVRRAVVLMGPRRVGKSVMIYQVIQALIEKGVAPECIFYVSVDVPVYVGLSLEKLLNLFMEAKGHNPNAQLYVFFDEVQYHKDWERHLKALHDAYEHIRFAVSGSAAAALRMKSNESGAGRFVDFLLPPLSFYEFMKFKGVASDKEFNELGVEAAENHFIDYINFGGFPEVAMESDIQRDMDRYVSDGIIDKVLLRDLPSLYGIDDPQELKRLFTVLALNTGQEVNLEKLSSASGLAKNTLRKYIEYLEASYLVKRLHRVDYSGQKFKRETHFKIYLTNTSLRAAMFGPLSAEDPNMGTVAESAYYAQCIPSNFEHLLYYARWDSGRAGEIDFVELSWIDQKVESLIELKWSKDLIGRAASELAQAIQFSKKHGNVTLRCLSRNDRHVTRIDGVLVRFSPIPEKCFRASASIVNPQMMLAQGYDLEE